MTKPVISSFNAIAPLLIQQYEHYLPTSFDESLSILQKVNKIIKKLDELGLATNDVLTQWNTVMEWVMNDGLTESVTTTLDAMVADGTFDSIINGTIFQGFTTRLNSITLHVSMYATLQDAINDAKLKNLPLDIGNGQTIVTSNLTDVHNIVLRGKGSIKRNNDVFYPNPTNALTNILYVSVTNGNDANDGLTSVYSLKTVQKAFDILAGYGQDILRGNWTIQCDSGTYPEAVRVKEGLLVDNWITLNGANVGGYPVVPTTIFTQGMGAGAVGLFATYGTKLKVNDILYSGYNGTTSSAGVKVAFGSQLITSNVHASNCYWGISGETQSRITIPNGIFDTCGFLNGATTGNGAGIRSLQQNNHYIGDQNATSRTNGAIFRNCAFGVFAQEFSTGHVNWLTIQDCKNDGIRCTANSRANADGVAFYRNARAIRYDGSSNIFVSSTTVFGTGADINLNPIASGAGGQLYGTSIFAEGDMGYSKNERIVLVNNNFQTINTISSSILDKLTLKYPHWNYSANSVDIAKKIRVRIYGKLTGTAGFKKINLRLSNGVNFLLAGLTFAQTESGDFDSNGELAFGTNTQALFLTGGVHSSGITRKSLDTDTLSLTNDYVLSIEAQVENTADTITVNTVEFSFVG
jgi:hypothetical protein